MQHSTYAAHLTPSH